MNILYIYDKIVLPFFNDYPLVCHPFLFDILNSYFLVDKKNKAEQPRAHLCEIILQSDTWIPGESSGRLDSGAAPSP